MKLQHASKVESGKPSEGGAVQMEADPSSDEAVIQQSQEIVQKKSGADSGGDIGSTAAAGVKGAGSALPHLDAIQASFGHHDVSGVQSFVGGDAATATKAMGANGYAMQESSGGDTKIAFNSAPDLHLAAHEAAHAVQQKGGVQLDTGVGKVGDKYEQHADAVADLVVQGKSAEGLLDQFAGGGGSGGAVQHKKAGGAVQFSIKSDLREAMEGWGTDEDAIYQRLRRASPRELESVVNDDALMGELRGELSHSEMKRVLGLLNAPIEKKLDLAMDGWGTDESYIHEVLARATPAELTRVSGNDAMVTRLEGELSGEDLKRVIERLNLPLERRLKFAMRGWGTDEAYINDSIRDAPITQVTAVANDSNMMSELDGELTSEEQAVTRGLMAFRIFNEAANAELAFSLLYHEDKSRFQQRCDHYGNGQQLLTLCDQIITTSSNTQYVLRAFEAYWGVDTDTENTTSTRGTGDAAVEQQHTAVWGTEILKRVHDHLKDLPPQDARNSVFSTLTLLAGEGGATMNRAGNFRLGERAMANRNDSLQQAASAGDTEIFVTNAASWRVGRNVSVGPTPSPDVHQVTAQDTANNKLTLNAGLSKAYPNGAIVTDGSTNNMSTYGVGTHLAAQAAAGDTDIQVRDVDRFNNGDTIAVGTGASREVHTIAAKDPANNKYTLSAALANTHGNWTQVTPDDASAFRRVSWLEAVIRHEIAHSVDTAVGGVTGFTQGLGGWWTDTDFDTWANAMGNPWQTNDGTTISEDDKKKIKDHINSERGGDGGHALNNGLDATHPINTYWNSGVPVIEASKPCVQGGKQYWTSPENVKGFGGKYFAINHYYHKYQYYNASVQQNRVRDYSIFSPAEFFAEVYTVYYEEAGNVPDSDLGRLVPVASWRNWITSNIHNRNMDPTSASEAGNTSGGTGMKTGQSGE